MHACATHGSLQHFDSQPKTGRVTSANQSSPSMATNPSSPSFQMYLLCRSSRLRSSRARVSKTASRIAGVRGTFPTYSKWIAASLTRLDCCGFFPTHWPQGVRRLRDVVLLGHQALDLEEGRGPALHAQGSIGAHVHAKAAH